MKKPIIHRYAYLPTCNLDTDEYSWRRLKVVKVWVEHLINGLSINYVLENCNRFSQNELYTENDVKDMCPRQHHNIMLTKIRFRTKRFNFHSQTIYSPATEISCQKNNGKTEFMELIEDSKKIIQECKDNDYIIGEETTQEIIDHYYNKN